MAALPLITLAMLAAAGISAIGEEAVPAAVPADDSMWQFGRRQTVCLEWTDDCRQCRRTDADEIACSNVGIACQPKDIQCTVSKTQK